MSVRVSNSQRSSFGCQRRWFVEYVLRLRKAKTEAPLRRGQIWHAAMEGFWAGGWDDAIDILADLEELDRESAIKHGGLEAEHEAIEDHALIRSMLKGYDRRWGMGEFRTLMNEERLEVHLRDGMHFIGIVDKVAVDQHGQHWLIEHKTSSSDLSRWRERNAYKPQAATYAWLLERQHGIKVAGVVYDLALTKRAPSVEDWQVLKSGKAMSKVVPAGFTVEQFDEALALHGFQLFDAPWYSEKRTDLQHQEDPFFRREVYRFTPDEIGERMGWELAEVTAKIRDAYWANEKAAEQAENATDEELAAVAAEWAWQNPRNADLCYQWHRPCPYMTLCRYGTVEGLADLRRVDPDKRYRQNDQTNQEATP